MLMLSDKLSTSYRSRLHDPTTVPEYPKLPLSRLSDVIKWQAPLKHRQADGQTNMPRLHSLSSAWLWQAVGWCDIVWFGVVYPFDEPATWSAAGFENNKIHVTLSRFSIKFIPQTETQQKNKNQLGPTASSLFHFQDSVRLGFKDSGASGLGPDGPQRG